LRLGVQLPEVERQVSWPEYVAMARAAEEVGFDSVWLGDHLLYRGDGREERGPWDAWSMLAGLAAVTARVRLGPLVACTAFSPPGLLARKAASVQEISNGRLVLGLGAGWNRAEFDAFGLPFDNRAARFIESFEVIRRLAAGDRVTLHGDFVTIDDAVVLPLNAHPMPLMVGSVGDRVLRATLPHVDAWNCWYAWFGNNPDGFATLNQRITTIVTDTGRDPGTVQRSAAVFVALDEAGADRPHADLEPIRGSNHEISQRLAEFADAGVDEAILVLNPIDEQSIRSLADVVATVTNKRDTHPN
jgi:alkanesulfonate monooxygenase SsuD/methylene tetrahydromethanopterin reductase-like flavin-dependent oxidoreductase (luciferase family)